MPGLYNVFIYSKWHEMGCHLCGKIPLTLISGMPLNRCKENFVILQFKMFVFLTCTVEVSSVVCSSFRVFFFIWPASLLTVWPVKYYWLRPQLIDKTQLYIFLRSGIALFSLMVFLNSAVYMWTCYFLLNTTILGPCMNKSQPQL